MTKQVHKSLALSTDQIYRNNETAKVTVSVRNIEKVTVSMYKLDLEKFFRSHHRFDTASGIEALDVELIQPDKTWEVELTDYTKHKTIEQEIDIPLEGKKPGVAIVRVEGDGWQASTIVLRSNIDLITKAAWREGLVFVSNALTNKAVNNAEVLISDGKEIIGQGQTNADGIFRLKGQMIRDSANLHFYVRSKQGEAVERLNIIGMTQEITNGRTDDRYATLDAKGFLYTNKSTYQFGDRVHVRGIFRDVKDGDYVVNAEEKVEIELLAPGGKSVRKWEVQLNQFGSFSLQFDMPTKGAGTFVLQAKLKDASKEVSYSQRISLSSPPSREKQLVTIHFDSQSVLKGEPISGEVRVITPWGRPIANQQVKLTYPDGRSEKLSTDEHGLVPFTQDSTDLESYQRFSAELIANALGGHQCHTSRSIYIQSAAFQFDWAKWPVVTLPGQPLVLSVKVGDENGEPVEQELQFEIQRLPDGAEYQVLSSLSGAGYRAQKIKPIPSVSESVTSKIDQDGVAELKVEAPEAGRYLVTVSGVDAKGNEVRSSKSLEIAGEKKGAIRLFADSETVTVGGTLKATVYSSVDIPQALMTVAGTVVMENRVLQLNEGANEIELPITDKHWPRFEIVIGGIHDGKKQSFRRQFVVERKLDIELNMADQSLSLGEEAEVELITRDASGNPVSAEVFLNLSGSANDHRHSLLSHFSKNLRPGSSSRVGASLPFKHAATTYFSSTEGDGDQIPVVKQNHLQLLEGVEIAQKEKRLSKIYPSYDIERDQAGAQITKVDSMKNASTEYFWSGAIVTNDQGVATVKVNVPNESGKWKLSAVGCDAGSLYGNADIELETSKSVAVSPVILSGLRQGDQWTPEISIQISGDQERSVKISSKAGENSQEKTVSVKPGRAQSVYFDAITLESLDPLTWEVSVDGAVVHSQTISPLPKQSMRPNYDVAALPDKQSIEAYLDQAMMDLDKQTDASALLSAVSALKVYRKKKLKRPELEDQIQKLILTLQVTQKEGGWPWAGVNWSRDSWTTAVGLWGLREAKELGFEVNDETLKQGVAYLQQLLTIVPPEEPEKSAMILFALAREDAENFSIANRLYRQRKDLNPATLAFLAGTFSRMKRDKETDEILDLLLKQASQDYIDGSELVARISQAGDITAVALNALAERKSPQAKKFANWLIQHDCSRFGSISTVQGVWLAALTKHFSNQPNQTLATYPATLQEEGRATSDLLPEIVNRRYTVATNLPYEDRYLSSRGSSEIKVAQLGQVIRVAIEIKKPKQPYPSYLQIDEAIPAGCVLMPNSLKAKHAKVEEVDGGIRIITLPNWDSQIEYQLIALHPGQFHIPATVIRDNCRPDRYRIGQPADLNILPEGEVTPEIYQMNVAERLELARLNFKDNNYEEALKHLNALTSDFKDDDQVATYEREISRMLLWIHATLPDTDPKVLVERFEALSERHSDVVIPFDKILKVAEAYKSIGELERSWLVYRAVVESNFINDAKVAIMLKQLGDFLGYADTQESLWYQYPDAEDVIITSQAFAQDLETQAGTIGSMKLRKGQTKPERDALLERSRDLLNRLLTLHPDTKEADVDAFRLANLHFDLKDYSKVAAVAKTAVQMFPDSRFQSSFQYMTALGHFWQYEFPESLKSAQPVAQGRTANAANAKYIIAQVYHAQGDPAKAIEWYEKVRNEFTDARQSLDYLKEKAIKLPNSKTFAQGEQVTIDVDYRNIKEVDLQVYKVDLMRLYSRQKDLTNISKVSLAGISPETELAVELGNGEEYQWQNRKLELPITEEGAYLVVCRGDSTFTSSLVLISPLELKVRESVGEGELRFHLWNPKDKAYVADAEIKVFDSANNQAQQGRTDPRGVFHASRLTGFATVIVKHKETSYAYYRSTEPLSKLQVPQSGNGRDAQSPNRSRIVIPQAVGKPSEKERYFRALKSELEMNSKEQKKSFDKLLKQSKGVKASKAYKY